jgi:hypothetical protein
VTLSPTYESAGGQERGVKADRLFLMVAIPSGSDMPAMDSALTGGKCDPYCKVQPLSINDGRAGMGMSHRRGLNALLQ